MNQFREFRLKEKHNTLAEIKELLCLKCYLSEGIEDEDEIYERHEDTLLFLEEQHEGIYLSEFRDLLVFKIHEELGDTILDIIWEEQKKEDSGLMIEAKKSTKFVKKKWIITTKDKAKLQKRKKALDKLRSQGKDVDSLKFKANFFFNSKTGNFEKRKKPLDIKVLKAKIKRFNKIMKIKRSA